tara:strand:+ start:21936 stop:22643 length:708 start_codon:yes stop_codon:yes gene_type:complete
MSIDSIAIILARGNSKRLPKKNILEFNSQPMISWTIQAAIKSNKFNKVIVSTDSKEIADIARSFDAEVPFLRETAADDFAHSSDATFFALKQAEKYWGTTFNYVTQLMANCPMRTSDDIINGFNVFKKSNSYSQISCFNYGWMMPWWALKLNKDGTAEKLFPNALKQRSQDLPELFCPTGALWIARRDEFVKTKSFYMKNTRFEPIHWISAVDIDNYDDLLMAELCLSLRNKIRK